MRPAQKTALIAALAAGHPVTGAYNIDDALAADEINVKNIAQDVGSISGADLFGMATGADYAALTDTKKSQWISLCGVDSFAGGGPLIRLVRDIWGNGSNTATTVNAATSENVSAAQQLGFRINKDDITEARV